MPQDRALMRQIPCSLVMWVFGFSSSHLPIFVHGIQSLQTLKARCSPMPSTLWRDAQSRTCFMSCCSSWGLTCVYLFKRRSEEHTSELQSLLRTSYAVFCLEQTKA